MYPIPPTIIKDGGGGYWFMSCILPIEKESNK
jgi:hypothetical protein